MLQEVIAEQLGLLADSCHTFDGGRARQVKAISVRLYSICHDMVRNPDWKSWSQENNVQFVSYSRAANPKNLIPMHSPLVTTRIGPSGASYMALGADGTFSRNMVRLSRWWDEHVLRLRADHGLSRKNIVFQMRNYDGGGHGMVGAPSNEYREIKEARGLGFLAVINGQQADFRFSALEATTRQIAHEVLESLMPHLEDGQRTDVGYDLSWTPST